MAGQASQSAKSWLEWSLVSKKGCSHYNNNIVVACRTRQHSHILIPSTFLWFYPVWHGQAHVESALQIHQYPRINAAWMAGRLALLAALRRSIQTPKSKTIHSPSRLVSLSQSGSERWMNKSNTHQDHDVSRRAETRAKIHSWRHPLVVRRLVLPFAHPPNYPPQLLTVYNHTTSAWITIRIS